MIKNFILIGVGGALGSMLRYLFSLLIQHKQLPWATLLVNIIGSFIIGIVVAESLKNEIFANNWRLFLATGICGGFTTFSAFSLENLQLLQNGKYFLQNSKPSDHPFFGARVKIAIKRCQDSVEIVSGGDKIRFARQAARNHPIAEIHNLLDLFNRNVGKR